MRIAHITDVHWTVDPSPWHVWRGKRLLGTANLVFRGRRHHFDERAQTALVAHVTALTPDAVIVSGDLTAQAIPAEFAKARESLDPILTRFPTLVIPGNHDVYTFGSARSRRIERTFGPWMGLDRHRPLGRLDHGALTILGLDPNRPGLLASGKLPREQLEALAALLADPTLTGRRVILACHYPLLGPGGKPYDNVNHGLLNAKELIAVLKAAPAKPDLVVHGHKHHGYRSAIQLDDGREIPIFDPGSGGYAHAPDEGRTAAMNLYTLSDSGLTSVERHLWDGTAFAPEAGGLYASGF